MNAIQCLNLAFDADPNAIQSLVANRVPCNQFLADDRFVQVGECQVLNGQHYQVGALGLVNAVLAAEGLPMVASMWGEPDENGRRKLTGFCQYKPEDDGAQAEA